GVGIASDVLATIGVGVVLALMAFGFFGLKTGIVIGVVATLASAPFAIGFLHTYPTLSGSLIAYSVSTIVCVAITMMNRTKSFDFELIKVRTGSFDTEATAGQKEGATR
ncbi:MAG: sodium:proline symporter, partial [Microbacterium gubbeenense]